MADLKEVLSNGADACTMAQVGRMKALLSIYSEEELAAFVEGNVMGAALVGYLQGCADTISIMQKK